MTNTSKELREQLAWHQYESEYEDLSPKEKSIIDGLYDLFTQQLNKAIVEAQIKELITMKPYLNGKYNKEVHISGDGLLVLMRVMEGFSFVTNRIATLKQQLKDGK